METFSQFEAITPIDGRTRATTKILAPYFSFHGQVHYQVRVELEYLKALTNEIGTPLISEELSVIDTILSSFSRDDVERIWKIYKEIRHDTKAIELYLREKFSGTPLTKRIPLLHFGLTSADTENLAFSMALQDFVKENLVAQITLLKNILVERAEQWKNIPMLARTHGQWAIPTTLGKEIVNFAIRIYFQELAFQKKIKFYGKLNGAVGNFNAHVAAFPHIDWILFSENFVRSLGLEPLLFTTQIPPYETLVRPILDRVRLTNTILAGLAQDMWRYISDGYLVLSHAKNEIGSSTMPQKVNPIEFEAAESYLSSANALLDNMSRRLPINRLQRDLTDKYLLRDYGSAMAYSIMAYHALSAGMKKITPGQEKIERDLAEHWEVLGEAIQTILRARGHPDAYEFVRQKVQGKTLTRSSFQELIRGLDVPDEIKKELLSLSPETYIGKAGALTEKGILLAKE